MKQTLRVLALVVALGASLAWLAMGANRGWTRTSSAVKTVDDVTGIEIVQYHNQFTPGVDLLACAWLGAGIMAGVSLLFSKQQTKQTV